MNDERERASRKAIAGILREEKPGGTQVLILLLSIYVLIALLVESVFAIPTEISWVLQAIDSAICVVFIGDFAVRFHNAEDKGAFLKWGWIDLISSIPYVDVFRWGRVVRIIRIVRAIRSAKVITEVLYRNRAKAYFASILALGFVTVIFSSIAILNCETDTNANIKTGSDALWWCLTTMSTVGYGDKFPMTNEGRLVGIVLMFVGITLFAAFTAFLGNYLVADQKDDELEPLASEIRSLRDKIDALEATIKAASRHRS